MTTIEKILLTLFVIWVIGTVIITNKHSDETFLSLLKLRPPQTTFLGWIYLILWGIIMLSLIGLTAYLTGYHYH